MVTTFVGASYLGSETDIPRNIRDHAEAIDEFSAAGCHALCFACESLWIAERGSWHFAPFDCDASEWDFEDATGFSDDKTTISCPNCESGKVGFMII
jgi:rubredoxin